MASKLHKFIRDPSRHLARKIHPLFGGPHRFFLQSLMDIDPRSIWHNPQVPHGFLIPEGRRIADLHWWDRVRRDMLVLLLRDVIVRQVRGDFAELGVYRGLTARLIHQYAPERTLHLFDTFSGFDESDVEEPSQSGSFGDTSVKAVMRTIEPRGKVIVHAGRFPATITPEIELIEFAFVHLDADLFEPTMTGLKFFYPRVPAGGVIVVHDYNAWPGARRAVDEFFADKREFPIPMPDKSGSAVIVKAA